MDDPSFRGLLSQLIPDNLEGNPGQNEETHSEPDSRLMELLKTASRQAGSGMENEVNDFLNGKGALLETTRAAAARGGASAASEVAAFLTRQFHLSAPVAALVAPLILRIFPAIGTFTGSATTEKPRPRRRKKSDSSEKPTSTHKPKKPKPASSTKPAASHKPKKPSTGKPKPKRPKASSSHSGAKRPSRSEEIDPGSA